MPPSKIELIRQWAADRNLIHGSTTPAQMMKFIEELGETSRAIQKQDKPEIKDGFGDCVVVLTIMAAQNGLRLEDCIDAAYEEIKDRKGRMIDGIFHKEA